VILENLDSFRFDEVFFYFPKLSHTNIIILNLYMYVIKCKKLLLI
jgi:hypothetical protein